MGSDVLLSKGAEEVGLVYPKLTILPKGKCKIVYFDSKKEKGGGVFSGNLFVVVNREQIEIIRLLKEVLKELKKEKK